MQWTQQERILLQKWFSTRITEKTLFERIYALNPLRSYEAMTRELRRMREQGWVRDKDAAIKTLKVGYLDIEATHLKADFGYILSWCIKAAGKKHMDYSVITRDEIFSYKFDRRLVEEILTAFDNYDVLYTHYGADRRFDYPYIRTRAYAHGLEGRLPARNEKFIMDTWPIARNKLALHSNRLGSIAEAVGIDNVKKTPLSGKMWRLAAVGHQPSLDYILDHNIKDVKILERVHKKLALIESYPLRSV